VRFQKQEAPTAEVGKGGSEAPTPTSEAPPPASKVGPGRKKHAHRDFEVGLGSPELPCRVKKAASWRLGTARARF